MRPILVGGDWVTTGGGAEDVNPSDTRDVVDVFAEAGVAETEDAIAAAVRAAPAWARTTPRERAAVLAAAADEVEARRDELGRLLSREEGKPLPDGVAEAERAARILDFFAGEAVRNAGEKIDSVRPGIEVETSREPVGVVAVICPWNFPLAIPAWKIAPALAFGNAVVVKPAELVPGCAWTLADILQRAGLPPGVLNLLVGRGAVVGEAILEDPRVEAVSFTGSVATGRRVAEACARHMRRVQLEMGGKNPLVVLDDADLATAVECAVNGAYFQTGQRCTASSRLVVTEGIHNRFVEALVERLAALRVDDALAQGTDIGPVVDARQLESDLDWVEIGRREGANLRFGGRRLERAKPGFYMEPALFTDTTSDMRINREEIFGPVASVVRVRDYEEALAVANDTAYGLVSGIVTTSLGHASHFRRNAEAGMVTVNLPTAGVDFHVPFGGRKASSLGPREQGAHAREFYTQVKTAYVRP